MSIQAELSRIINAKSAIKAAIEGKGVTVPEATLLDGMAALIDAIEAGGGGAKYSYGTFTPSEDVVINLPYKIEHNSGFVPDVFIVRKSNLGTYVKNGLRYAVSHPVALLNGDPISRSNYYGIAYGWGSASYNTLAGGSNIFEETTSALAYIRADVALKVIAGNEYKWFAIGGLE